MGGAQTDMMGIGLAGRGAEGQGQPARAELAQTSQQRRWQKAQQASDAFSHRLFAFCSCFFLLLHLDHGQNEKEEGQIENLVLFN